MDSEMHFTLVLVSVIARPIEAALRPGRMFSFPRPTPIDAPTPPPPSLFDQEVPVVMVNTMFAWLYYVDGDEDNPRFWSRDGFVLNFFEDVLGFYSVIEPPEDGTFNSSTEDILMDLVSGTAEFSFNCFTIMEYITSTAYSPVVFTQWSVVVVPRGNHVLVWINLLNNVSMLVWLLLGVLYVSAACLWSHSDHQSYFRAFATVMNFLTSASKSRIYRLQPLSARILVFVCCAFSIVFGCAFQGMMFENLTNVKFQNEITTLTELDESGLPIIATGRSIADAFYGSDLPLGMRLSKKVTVENLVSNSDFAQMAEHLCTKKDFAVVTTDIGALFMKSLVNSPDTCMRILDDPVSIIFEAYAIAPDSPYREVFNYIIGILLQSGLWLKWHQEAIYVAYTSNSQEEEKTVRLAELKAVFAALFGVYGVAFLIFLVELAIGRKLFERATNSKVPHKKQTFTRRRAVSAWNKRKDANRSRLLINFAIQENISIK